MFTLPTLIMGRVAPDHMQEGIAYRVQVQGNHSTRVCLFNINIPVRYLR